MLISIENKEAKSSVYSTQRKPMTIIDLTGEHHG